MDDFDSVKEVLKKEAKNTKFTSLNLCTFYNTYCFKAIELQLIYFIVSFILKKQINMQNTLLNDFTIILKYRKKY